ncbi:ABC excinuclease alternative subunit C [Obesumbacterium proteus ATCC 12841]|uniref:Excinuclease cho n=2 Tax=Obesumbacterium proteus TaxID=82983 RepID=A0AA91EGL0_9GAMM|nr:ABC excinuclease alternative subunit C [Obesumbacterium proteus ATCC 12841]
MSILDEDMYKYPEHLKKELAALPSRPGVYIFHGTSKTMPLYIGKSVNIRSRVMSHFRNKNEAKLLHLTTHIEHIEMAGELGALLIEAQLIKAQKPLFNKKLRHAKQLCSLSLKRSGVEVVYAGDRDFWHEDQLFGLFPNKSSALDALRAVADQQRLCYGVLGLERLVQGSSCFRYALKRCAGACCGKESLEEHQLRLVQAMESMRVQCWPYNGKVAVEESCETFTQYHIINNWFYLGTVGSLQEAKLINTTADCFDRDGYKILCKPLLSGKFNIIALE